MPNEISSVILVGGGKMGGALLNGWIKCGTSPNAISLIEPDPKAGAGLCQRFGVRVHTQFAEYVGGGAQAIVFAVKPQVMDSVVRQYRQFVGPTTVFLSIAAGKTLGYFAEMLGTEAAVVRAMPNTPAAIGKGITVACGNAVLAHDQRTICDALLGAVGEVIWIDDEVHLDAVTAVSGSGPAYVFLLIECLTRSGTRAGLPPELANRLAHATVCGAGALAGSSGEPAEVLRKNVTSPGGTTACALDVLMGDDGIAPIFDRAVAAAAARSRELAQ
jgi:pyrroline-5-carboxylate reductase